MNVFKKIVIVQYKNTRLSVIKMINENDHTQNFFFDETISEFITRCESKHNMIKSRLYER